MLRHLFLTSALLVSSCAWAEDAGKIIFAAGNSQLDGQTAAVGATVREGAVVRTGADGFVYVKTLDNGLFILRPNSEARVVTYHVDQVNPQNTRVKFELVKGVARARSGDAVKQARQNFRFNTPVAAIGVRGTDFTVFTDNVTTRVTVLTGGVVVSGFGEGCRPEGAGPCEGGASRELFAAQKGQLLRVQKGKAAPEVLRGGESSPDEVAPPRTDEPVAHTTGGSAISTGPNLDAKKNDSLVAVAIANQPPPKEDPGVVLPPVLVPPVIVPNPEPVQPERGIVWGRWQSVLGQVPQINMLVENKRSELLATNGNFALYQTPGREYVAPERGSMGFKLAQSDVYMYTDYGTKRIESPASMSNGKLTVDFGARSFVTSADVTSLKETFGLQAQGVLGKNGRLFGDDPAGRTGVMNVQGLLSNEQNGTAVYIFDARLDKNRTVNGATLWRH
jgi:hypothetical protein